MKIINAIQVRQRKDRKEMEGITG